MRKILLTKHCALLLLALFATAWSTNAWALTINVNVTGSQAPYVYAWDNNENPLIGDFPGTQLTNIKNVGNKTWYYIDIDATNVNVILSFGSSATQTGNITDIAGNRYFEFDKNNANNVTDYYDCPGGFEYETAPFVYLVDTKGWTNAYAYVWNGNSNNGWPGNKMEYLGTNGNGYKVYRWSAANINFTPANIKFNNVADDGTTVYEEGENKDWTNGAFWSNYNWTYAMTVSGLILNGTNFPDANLRKAITASIGIAEGDAITIDNIKVLDVSYDPNKGMTGKITDPTGIERFTTLEELYAYNNDIKYLDLQNATALRVLDLHMNENLLGFGTGVPSAASNHVVRLPSGCLQYIDMSNTRLRNYAAAAFADKVKNTLETFIARDVYYTTDAAKFAFNSVPSVTTLTKLKYLDVSGCDGAPATIISDLANMKSTLEYLDISNQHMTANGLDPALNGFTALKTFKFNTQTAWTNALTINNCPALTHVDVSGNVAMTGLTINNTGITSINFPEAGTLSTLTHLTTLDVSNNPFTVLNLPQTPNFLLTVTANNCSSMTRILAEHNESKLQYITAHNCPALTDITINGADIYFNKQLNAFDATNKSTLVTLDLSNDYMSTNYVIDGFTALQTVDFDNSYMEGNNNTIHEFTATNCPALISVNLGGITNMQTVTLTNNGFSNSSYPLVTVDANASNVTLDFSNNNFTAIPNIQASQINVLKLNNNQLTDINLPSGCNINYLYAQENNFGESFTLDGDNLLSLKGVALSNKSSVSPLKTFTATVANTIPDEWDIDYSVTPPVTIQANADRSDGSNTTLESINLYGNTSLETVTVNGFKGLTKLASDNDMSTSKGKGLYVKGNTALKNLDISNNRIEILGQDNSLNGLSNLEKLNASHNKIMTLTNRSAISSSRNPRAHYGNNEYTSATCPNIEDLTGLKELDLTYNLLSDSIHLWKNTALERLDVSHNRTINQRNAGDILYYRDTKDGTFKQWKETSWKVVADAYTHDLNDTIGLRMLDLWHNTNLKYLDISYTNIENTALNWSYVNNRVGPENLLANATDHATGEIIGQMGVPRFVLVNHCPELLEFHTNYNAMKSLGVGHAVEGGLYPVTGCPKLEHLEAIECRGQDPHIMQGEITLSVYNPLLKYYNVSNSNFDKVNPYTNNEHGVSGQNLETLIVDGNYTRDNAAAWNLSNAGTLDVSHNPKLVNLQANKCPNLETVIANNLGYLDIISLTQDTTVTTVNDDVVTTKLANLYVDHDAILDEVLGLQTLSALSVYHANDSHFTGDFVMPALAKSSLTDLRVGNEQLSYASTRNNLTSVNLTDYTAVKHLETQNNPQVNALDISGFTSTLEHINFANNHIDNSGIGITDGGYLPSLPALKYFNCSNDSKWNTDAGNSLTDLILTNSAGIEEIYGNNNDLHYITGSFANLTNIEFAHNHINGIDLSAAPNATVNSEDNGRTILADCAKFTPHGDFGNVVTVYFFQLADLSEEEVQNGTLLTERDSKDSKNQDRYLGTDGMVIDKIANWTSDAAVLTTNDVSNLKNVTLNPDNMSAYLNASEVPGTIVVLKPANETANGADGQAKYNYTTGNGSGSEFYLNWSSDGTITGINSVISDNGFDVAGTYGGIVVAGKDGTVVGVYDLNGRLVASETITNGQAVITGLTPGIYMVNGEKVLVK